MSGWQLLCRLPVHGGWREVDVRTGTSARMPFTALGRRAQNGAHRRPARQVPGAYRRTGTRFPVRPGNFQGSGLVWGTVGTPWLELTLHREARAALSPALARLCLSGCVRACARVRVCACVCVYMHVCACVDGGN